MGYMGSGKSTIGRELADVLDFNFIDLDNYIEEKEGYTVSEIFSKNGEIYFRKQESFHLNKIMKTTSNIVLSLGGGTPCYSNNMETIINTENTASVYLKSSIPELYKRLNKSKSERPIINHLRTKEALIEFIGKHLFERAQFYNNSNFTINTDNKTIPEVVEAIVLKLI